jgi:hypothetical protein
MKVFKFTDSEVDWVVAEDEADAWRARSEHYEGADDLGGKVEALPDDTPIKIIDDYHTGGCVTKTAAEWAAETPRGLLCSTAY